jgi:hypothetical protein
MSLIELNLFQLTQKQYYYKLKAYTGMFFTMMIVQVSALLLSFGGVSGMSTSSNNMIISTDVYSGEAVIILTLIWAFVTGVQLTANVIRDIDFAFVSNRISSQLSTIGFMLTLAMVASIAATLMSVLLRVIMYLYTGSSVAADSNFLITPVELLISLIAIFLYITLLMSIGYWFGMLSQKSVFLKVLLPTMFFGLLFLEVRNDSGVSIIGDTFHFFVDERSLLVFSIKVIVSVIVLLGSAILLTNRLEVRK